MTQSKIGIEALQKHRAAVSVAKRLQVVAAIEELVGEGRPMNVAEVARRAEVSREFVYSHSELIRAVEDGRRRIASQVPDPSTAVGRERSLTVERDALLRRVARDGAQMLTMTTQIEEYERQRKIWLGAQLASYTDPVVTDELRAENERLNQRVIDQSRELDTLRSALSGLREDLRLSRLAHADALGERINNHDNVYQFRLAEPSVDETQ